MRNSTKLFVATLLFLVFGFGNNATAALRTWTGAVNLDFNNSGNWSGAGAILAGDVLQYTGVANQTLTMSASLTCAGLTFVANGGGTGRTCRLQVGAYTLTINGPAVFNAVNYNTPANYDVVYVNVNSGGTINFNGTCYFHTTGSGDSYLTTGNFATSGAATPGTVVFRSTLSVGRWGRTVGAYEPHMIFDAAGAQTANIKCNGGAYMFKSQDLTFGSTNTPTVTIIGSGGVYFNSYDGNMTIAANSSVIVPDCTLVGFRTRLDRYVTGAGTMTMGAGSLLRSGCPNALLPFNGVNIINGWTTYTLNLTSTVHYNSTGYQGVYRCTYGNLICDGVGNPGWKYSYGGAFTVAGDFTAQGSCIYGPYNASNLTVNGNTLIQTSATFNASRDNSVSGQIYTLLGHYTNNATFTSGSPVGVNTFTFNSTTAGQNIGGTSVTTFYNLINNNTSGSGCTLTQDENVSNVWTLTNGPVFLNSNDLTIQNSAAAAVVRTNGYAVSETPAATNPSRIIWQMAATTGNHIFPFGVATTGNYIPMTFNKVSATGATITAATRATAASDNLPWATGVTQMYDPTLAASGAVPATVDRWWEITSTAAITANITFSYRGVENTLSAPYNTGNVGAQYWSAAWLPNNSNIGATPAVGAGVGSVTANGLSIAAAFTPWVLSSSSAPLPVELVSTTATCDNDNAVITWTTASEINNNFFTVERSADGENFVEVGRVDGSGTTSQMHTYSLVDHHNTGFSYYRIRQTDYNGASTVSPKFSYNACSTGENSFDVINAGNNSLVIGINSNADANYNVYVSDVTGRIVNEQSVFANEGSNRFEFSELNLTSGVYMVSIIDGNGTVFTEKILISE